jgi:hypothetical protein
MFELQTAFQVSQAAVWSPLLCSQVLCRQSTERNNFEAKKLSLNTAWDCYLQECNLPNGFYHGFMPMGVNCADATDTPMIRSHCRRNNGKTRRNIYIYPPKIYLRHRTHALDYMLSTTCSAHECACQQLAINRVQSQAVQYRRCRVLMYACPTGSRITCSKRH